MDDIRSLVWLFPVLFMLHDFEEIILMKRWLNRNRDALSLRFPRLSKRFLSHFDGISTASFTIGVAEEFVLICIVCAVSLLTGWYALWFGMFFAFLFHLLVHIAQSVAVGGYVPALVTSLLFLPPGCYIAFLAVRQATVPFETLLFFALVSVVGMVLNLVAVHRLMESLEDFFGRN